MNRSSMVYHHWLRNIKEGDSVIVAGDLIALSMKHKIFGVCHIETRKQGVVCQIQEVTESKIRVADTSFNVTDGRASKNSSSWRLKLLPVTPVPPAVVKELKIYTRGG